MPATRRAARLIAPLVISFSLALTSLVAAPAQAVDGTARDHIGTAFSEQDDIRKAPPLTRKERKQIRRKRHEKKVFAARDIALKQRGDRYSYGAAGPDRFDCSGLVYFSFRKAGIDVPRTSRAQAGHARRISRAKMRSGDLMFFYGSGGVYHVGVFLRWERGRAVMVHAPSTGSKVRTEAAWTSQWFPGTLRRR